jgi:selenocysteine-specific elongation factor
MDRYVILGTAGHIDHGKSALVKALTGIDPDRLKEEKERGITIDLGFANLSFPEGLNVGIVDVPGHERLVKNMLAGAGGIDLVLLVIAADEGVMPQSREHLAICNLLKIKKGLTAITKSDLVDSDWVSLVQDDVEKLVRGTFLEDSPIVSVSSKTGDNLELLKEKIYNIASEVEPKPVTGIFRLPVDRVFTMKGFGTVVTGTAVSGSVSVNDILAILPKGKKAKVRGLQSHGRSRDVSYAGQRVSINLQGIEKQEIHRGDILTIPEKILPTVVLDAEAELLKDSSLPSLKNRSLVHFHTGTAELTGRVVFYDKDALKPGESTYCQFRFKNPFAVMAGDRFIIRRFSPLQTIGGGEILDPSPPRRKRKEGLIDLKIFHKGNLEEKLSRKIFHSGINGSTSATLEGWIKAELPDITRAIQSLIQKGEVIHLESRLLHHDVLNYFKQDVSMIVQKFHEKNPMRPGIQKENLRASFRWLEQRLFDELLACMKNIELDKEIIRLKNFKISLNKDRELLQQKILSSLLESAFQPLTKDELAKKISVNNKEMEELLKIMVTGGSLVRINDTIYLPSVHFRKMIDSLKAFFKTKAEMTVGEFRDILGTSRKYALPFLEYLDSNKVTLRVGEVRKLLVK